MMPETISSLIDGYYLDLNVKLRHLDVEESQFQILSLCVENTYIAPSHNMHGRLDVVEVY